MRIIEHRTVLSFLEKKGLLKQYEKAKFCVVHGITTGPKLKKRKPYSKNQWQFRINRQYRALCSRQGDTLYVYDIDDHQ